MSVSFSRASTTATLIRCAPALPPKIKSVNLSPAHRIPGLSHTRARKIPGALLIGSEHAVHQPRQNLVGETGTEILFHDGAANAFYLPSEEKRAGGVSTQADDQVRAKLPNEPQRPKQTCGDTVESIQKAAKPSPSESFDRQSFELESFLRKHPRFDSLFRTYEQDLRHRISSLKFTRHGQPREQVATGSPAGQDHAH